MNNEFAAIAEHNEAPMKHRILSTIFATLLAFASLSTTVLALDASTARPAELKPLPQQPQAARLAAAVLSRYHYKPLPLDDEMSVKIFDQYLKALDPEKMFFVQTDVKCRSIARSLMMPY